MPLKFMGNHLSRFVWKTLCHSLGQAFGVVPLIFCGTSYCLILERDKFHDLSRGVLLVCADVYVEANIRGLVFSESYRSDLFEIFFLENLLLSISLIFAECESLKSQLCSGFFVVKHFFPHEDFYKSENS